MKNAQTVGWNLWLQWVLAYALGSLAGGAIARPLGEAVGSVLGAAVAGLVVGAALGLAQAVVLGRYLKAGTPGSARLPSVPPWDHCWAVRRSGWSSTGWACRICPAMFWG